MGARSRLDTEFTEYVTSRASWLRKVAFLLCGDWHRADDLTQTSVTKLYTNWHRAKRADNIDGYVRKIVVNTFLAEQRTGWRKLVDLGRSAREPVADANAREEVLDLREALAKLTPKQRAVIVLRFYCDLSVVEVAKTLGCTAGTVKSQTARSIDALRRLLGAEYTIPSEVAA